MFFSGQRRFDVLGGAFVTIASQRCKIAASGAKAYPIDDAGGLLERVGVGGQQSGELGLGLWPPVVVVAFDHDFVAGSFAEPGKVSGGSVGFAGPGKIAGGNNDVIVRDARVPGLRHAHMMLGPMVTKLVHWLVATKREVEV